MGCKAIVVILFVSMAFVPIAQARKITLVTLEYPPYVFQSNRGPTGIAVDLVREAFNRIDTPFSVQVLPWGRAIREIRNGRADGIFTIYRTPEREAFMDYSDEVLIEQSIALFSLSGQPIDFDGSVSSLAPYSIGIVRKVSYGAEIDTAIQEGLLKNLVTANSGVNSFKLLTAKRVDVVISNQLGGLEIMKHLDIEDKVSQLPFYSYDIPSFIAFSKKGALETIKQQIDMALQDMKNDGTYQRIVGRYLKRYKDRHVQLFKLPTTNAEPTFRPNIRRPPLDLVESK